MQIKLKYNKNGHGISVTVLLICRLNLLPAEDPFDDSLGYCRHSAISGMSNPGVAHDYFAAVGIQAYLTGCSLVFLCVQSRDVYRLDSEFVAQIS